MRATSDRSKQGPPPAIATIEKTVQFAPPSIGQPEIDEVVAAMKSGWLTTGPRVREFERRFAEYIGVEHAVAVNSCTAALHLSLLAAGIREGDEVITTPLTFCATANVIVHTGATPVFADIDPITFNLSPEAADNAVTSRSTAVIPVHYAGRPADMCAFRALTNRIGMVLIEDAAHAVESATCGKKIGTTADFSCFSFYATKNLTTGEGGMLTTSSAESAEYARIAALHGMSRDAWNRYGRGGSPHYDVVMPGFKYNMMDLQAAIGLHQLAGIERSLARRAAICELYDQALADLPLTRPAPVAVGDVHGRHLYTVLVQPASGWTRDALAAAMHERGVITSIHFRALHLQPYYQERFGFERGMFPQAEFVSDHTLSLPLSGGMSDSDALRVIDVLRDLMQRGPLWS